jgi:hypothetical protein
MLLVHPVTLNRNTIVSNPLVVPDAAKAEPVPIFTTVLLLELQKPPVVASVKIVSPFTQTLATPDIGAGKGLTVTIVDVLQPELSVYVMLAVPAAFPVTKPELNTTLAKPGAPLVQSPPVKVSVSVVCVPIQIEFVPVMIDGDWFTVTLIVE